MPKNSRRHKNPDAGSRPGAHRATAASGIKDLLTRQPALQALKTARARQDSWRDWLEGRLPAELTQYITQVSASNGALVISAATAAWVARLRYAIAELEPQIRQHDAGIRRIRVRVLPAGSSD